MTARFIVTGSIQSTTTKFVNYVEMQASKDSILELKKRSVWYKKLL